MKNLTNRETLSCFFNNLGNIYQDVGDIDSALYFLEKAVQITPSLAMIRSPSGNASPQ